MNDFIIKLTMSTTKMQMPVKKLTQFDLREYIGKHMVMFSNKLKEWAGTTNSKEIDDFNTAICTLNDSNLKLLCCIVGKCFGDEATFERIKNRDEKLWIDKDYIAKLKTELNVTGKNFDLSEIFGNFAQKDDKINEAMQNDFWVRLNTICSFYQKLVAVDDAIYEDVHGRKRVQ